MNQLLAHPDYTEPKDGFLIDDIVNGAIEWRGCDLHHSLRSVRSTIARVLWEIRHSIDRYERHRRDFRVMAAVQHPDGWNERGGTVVIYQYVMDNGRLKKKLSNSGAI